MAILLIPVTKAGREYEFDTDAIDVGVFTEALSLGLKALLNRGQEKITKTLFPNAEALKAEATKKAEEVYAQLQAGEFRAARRAQKSELTGAERTEAMRLARNHIKDSIKRSGGKIGDYEAKDITAAAAALLSDPDQGPGIIADAKANLSAQAEKKVSVNVTGLQASPKKVAAREKKAAEDKAKRQAAKAAKEAGQPAPAKGAKPGKIAAGVLGLQPKGGKPASHVTH